MMTWNPFKRAQDVSNQKPPMVWNDADAIAAQVKAIIAEELGCEAGELTPESLAYDEADSVGTLEIIMLCEETFDIEIPDEDAEHLETVGQFVAYIQRKLGASPA